MSMVRSLGVLLSLVLTARCGLAEAGPPIPVPTTPITNAIELARAVLTKFDASGLKSKDMIVLSVNYETVANRSDMWRDWSQLTKKAYREKYEKLWYWKIVFVHPEANDYTARVSVSYDGKARYSGGTE